MTENKSRKNRSKRQPRESQVKAGKRPKIKPSLISVNKFSTHKKAEGLWLYGNHTVRAALANPFRKIKQVLATSEALSRLPEEIKHSAAVKNAASVERAALDAQLSRDAVHQGIAVQVSPLPTVSISDVLDKLSDEKPALVIALDQVTDPHNVGAVLRSAAAFGVKALILTRHNAPEETGVLAKAASGALENVPIIRATNLKRALKECYSLGFWSVGLEADADTSIDSMQLPHRCVFVLGAEGRGMRQTVNESCDFTARLPIAGPIESLNVSNASAIALYEWRRQQRTQ